MYVSARIPNTTFSKYIPCVLFLITLTVCIHSTILSSLSRRCRLSKTHLRLTNNPHTQLTHSVVAVYMYTNTFISSVLTANQFFHAFVIHFSAVNLLLFCILLAFDYFVFIFLLKFAVDTQ